MILINIYRDMNDLVLATSLLFDNMKLMHNYISLTFYKHCNFFVLKLL